ncbi:hypothetical protein AAHC03_020655 [Spirometra sp. Aus1]
MPKHENQEQNEILSLNSHWQLNTLPPEADPAGPPDPQYMKEIISGIEKPYFDAYFDSGKYEFESHLRSNFRNLKGIDERLTLLRQRQSAVCRQVSHLILEKQPFYQEELRKVMQLQELNRDAYLQCKEARSSLEALSRGLVEPHFLVLRNHRRCLRLKKVIEILRRIRTLKESAAQLDKLIDNGEFSAAIRLHRGSLLVTEDFGMFRCVDSLQHRLRAAHLRIDDALDAVLAKSCESFDQQLYAIAQEAYERLGSTQTTVAQLQLHYTTAIHTRAARVVASFIRPVTDAANPEALDVSDCQTAEDYDNLCKRLPEEALVPCLAALCKSIWNILVCYHRTALWHDNEANGHARSGTSKDSSSSSEELSTEEKANLSDSSGPMFNTDITRQWHGYVTSKLSSNRGRIWMDISSRVRPLLGTIAEHAQGMTFEAIAAVLNIVNGLVRVGEEFAGHVSSDLLEVLRNSIQQFFVGFHRKHMERLRLFLDNETWELCPVSANFTLLDLHEFHHFFKTFHRRSSSSTCADETDEMCRRGASERLFREPFTCQLFDVEEVPDPVRTPVDVTALSVTSSSTGSPTFSRKASLSRHEKNANGSESRESGPILASTTIEVLRLIGRYMQMMQLLKPIASEVMHCIGQLFDYYLFVIHNLFGSLNTSDQTAHLPDRLQKTIARISARLVASTKSPAVINGTRFAIPDCIANRRQEEFSQSSDLQKIGETIRRHIVGIESLVFLATVLETQLLSPLHECLPDSKHGLLVVFKEQSLVTAFEVRDSAGFELASKVFPPLLSITLSQNGTSNGNFVKATKTTPDSATSPPPPPSQTVLRQLIASRDWVSQDAVATKPSAYLTVLSTAIRRFADLLTSAARQLGATTAARTAVWRGTLHWLSGELLEGIAAVNECSEEGRSQMLLDVQSTALLCESESGIRPFVNLDFLVDYIQAFYVPVREWEAWLVSQDATKRYSQHHLTGLASCLSRGDRKTRQRLINTVNQMYPKKPV